MNPTDVIRQMLNSAGVFYDLVRDTLVRLYGEDKVNEVEIDIAVEGQL